MSKCKFTLIELLVVVAIIGILASLLLPSLQKARDRAHTAVCLSNQKQVSTAIQLYANSYDDTIPRAGYSWANILGSEDYLGVPKVDKFNSSNLNVKVQTQFNAFFCPSGLTDRVSTHAKSGQWNYIDFQETQRPWRSGDSASLYSKTQFPAGFDVWYGVVGSSSRDGGDWAYPTWRDSVTSEGWPKISIIEDPVRGAAFHDGTHHMHTHRGDQSRISARHNGAKYTNVAFYDGHAKTFLRATVVAGSTKGNEFDNDVIFQSARNP